MIMSESEMSAPMRFSVYSLTAVPSRAVYETHCRSRIIRPLQSSAKLKVAKVV